MISVKFNNVLRICKSGHGVNGSKTFLFFLSNFELKPFFNVQTINL